MTIPKEAILSAIQDSIQEIEAATGKKISKLSAFEEPQKKTDEEDDNTVELAIGTFFGVLLLIVVIVVVVKIVK